MRKCDERAPFLSVLIAIAFFLVAGSLPASAMDDDFYKGKQVRLIIGFGAGGSYDLYGQLVARYIGRHLPGNPTVITVSMPTAGSLNAVNYIYNVAPKDGTVFGIVASGAPTVPLFYPEQAKFDASKLTWIGSAAKAIFLDVVSSNVPVRTLDDLRTKEVYIGATGPGAAAFDLPRLMNALAGFRYHLVVGYDTVANIYLAMLRGEVQGVSGTTWDSVSRNPSYAAGKIRVVLQYGREKIKDLPDVPLALDLAKSEADRQAMNLLFARQEMGKPFVAPPDLPVEQVDMLRRAFDETMIDPDFLAAAKKIDLDVDPVNGEQVQSMVRDLATTPPAIVMKVKKILASD